MTPVSIAGLGATRFGRQPGVDVQGLAILAADAAIRVSGLHHGEVGVQSGARPCVPAATDHTPSQA